MQERALEHTDPDEAVAVFHTQHLLPPINMSTQQSCKLPLLERPELRGDRSAWLMAKGGEHLVNEVVYTGKLIIPISMSEMFKFLCGARFHKVLCL
jgi:hypothetical protein